MNDRLVGKSDIIQIHGPIDVHFLKSNDSYHHAFCFVGKGMDPNYNAHIISFTTEDNRGAVSCLLPWSVDLLVWKNVGVINKSRYMDDNSKWSDCTYITTITSNEFNGYQQWLIQWLNENRVYTIFEGGRTIRSFVSESIRFILRHNRIHSLFSPEIILRVLI